jgi:hypothetical protein
MGVLYPVQVPIANLGIRIHGGYDMWPRARKSRCRITEFVRLQVNRRDQVRLRLGSPVVTVILGEIHLRLTSDSEITDRVFHVYDDCRRALLIPELQYIDTVYVGGQFWHVFEE